MMSNEGGLVMDADNEPRWGRTLAPLVWIAFILGTVPAAGLGFIGLLGMSVGDDAPPVPPTTGGQGPPAMMVFLTWLATVAALTMLVILVHQAMKRRVLWTAVFLSIPALGVAGMHWYIVWYLAR